MTAFRAHDLLWLDDAAELVVDPRPRWATPAWLRAAPVVVRRATPARPGLLPVGLRGAMRSERCAAQLPAAAVRRSQTPEDIACRWRRRSDGRRALLPCLQALEALGPALDAQPLAWGVTGGVGFTLASGFDVLRLDSDLDLVVRAPAASDAAALRQVAEVLQRSPSRVDVQVDTPLGGFALAEWSRTGGPVLLKTARGPRLVDDPWHPAGHAISA